MNTLLAEFLNVVGVFTHWAMSYLIPASASEINILHIAVWTPDTLGLVTLSGGMVRRMTPKQIRTAQTDTPQKLAHVAKPNPSPRKASNQRKRVASTRAARAKAAAKREQEAPQRAQAQEEAKAQRAVLRAQAAQAQEEAKAQRAAQRAATRAQAASGCATRKPRCRGAERVGSRWRRVAGACARAHHGG